MEKLSPEERTQIGMKRLKPHVWSPKKLGQEIRKLVNEEIWPDLTANEYIWQIAQVKGKNFAEIVLSGFHPMKESN